jgi:indole-3-acetate monooxygenase
MPLTTPTTLTIADDVQLSDDVLALVADHAAANDERGHLDPAVVTALAGTGINRLMLPVELGGLAASPRRCVEVVERIAEADGSAAWAAAIGFGTNHFAGYVDRDGAGEVFADPDQSNAAMFAPLGRVTVAADGIERLSGRWPFSSNCEQAAWIGLAAMFEGEFAPRLVFARLADVLIHETWDVSGLRATASNDTEVIDLAVDRRHTCSFADRPWPEDPLWRLPLFTALTPPLAAVSLGVARRALDEINAQALARRAQMRGSLIDDSVGMGDLATADTLLRGARAGLLAAVDECWARAEDGHPIDRALQARAFLSAQHCTDVAVEVCATAHRLGGGAASYRSSPLLRALRDVETARQHAIFNRGLRPHLARTIAGTDEAHPPFVI